MLSTHNKIYPTAAAAPKGTVKLLCASCRELTPHTKRGPIYTCVQTYRDFVMVGEDSCGFPRYEFDYRTCNAMQTGVAYQRKS